MKTYVCIRRTDGVKYTVKCANKTELLEKYDISEEFFDIREA